MNNPTTLKQLVNWAGEELNTCSDSAKLDAKILFRLVSNYSDVDLFLKADEILNQEVIDSYRNIISDRLKGIPVAYLTGKKEFWSLNLKVTEDTLIPRPETELLVETALGLIPENINYDIVDLGTGSGAIACAIASERPNTHVIATDQSSAALKVARENAKTHALKNINLLQSNWFAQLPKKKFDLIVSNPPYVAAADINLTEGDVRFEPRLALTPGLDGLKDLRLIIHQSTHFLKSNAYLIVEHGYDQLEPVNQLFLDSNYQNITNLTDLNHQPRITYGQNF